METTRGSVNDRAWGLTLASFAQQRLTGELSVASPHGHIRVAFQDGNIVGAMSPVSSDSAVRVGVQLNLIIASAVQDLIRRVTASPSRDEVDVIAEGIRLPADQLRKLRRRVVAVRAARTFAFEHAAYAVSPDITLPVSPGNELDTRAVIYLGARMHSTAERLSSDLRLLGMRITFTQELIDDLPQFGFGPLEQPVIDGLMTGRSLAEVMASSQDVDFRLAQAVTYALATWTAPPNALMPRTISARDVPMIDLDAPDMAAQQDIGAGASVSFRAKTGSNPPSSSQSGSFPARQPSNTFHPPGTGTIPPPRASTSSSGIGRATPPVGSTRIPSTSQTPPLGIPRTTTRPSTPPVRPTPVTLSNPVVARTMSALGVNPQGTGSGIPATGSSPRLTRVSGSHPAVDAAPPSSPPKEKTPQEIKAEAMEARKRGEMALRREQLAQAIDEFHKAVSLDPKNGAALALLVWAQFCDAPDKQKVANDTRRNLAMAALNTEEPIAKLYLGRVERMLGRDKEALRHFQEVLFEHPRNSEAASEVRVLESRLASGTSKPFFKK